MAGLMRQSRGWWPHCGALGYGVAGSLAGLGMLLAESGGSNLLGALWLTHVIRHKHLRHHTDRADVVAVDLRVCCGGIPCC